MRFNLLSLSMSIVAALTACTDPPLPPTITPTVTNTPAVVVEVTHFPTASAAQTLAPTSAPTSTSAPISQPTKTPAPVVITQGGPPPTPGSVTAVPGTLIEYFRADPTQIDPGQRFTVSWKVKQGDATLWSITRAGQFGTSESVQSEGSKQIETSTTDRNFVQYLLYVQSGSQTESQTVTVKLTCPDNWFMDNPPTDCPATSASITQGVYQPFQGGFMIWIQSSIQIAKLIYVLYTDANSPRWSYYGDQWQTGMPEQDDTLTPPAGLFQPVRGFGKVWREQSGVKDRLGWALAAESSFQTAFQCNSAYKYTTCYLKGPNGVIVLQPESSGWAIWTGPTPPP